ncbi:MAG: WG repeat-containing protein [Bacteroidetes bacterium]|nr:WG repeat-containing protein [Bacteroidota bacterium]
MTKLFSSIALFFLIIQSTIAQSDSLCVLRLTVVDSLSGEPLPFVSVRLFQYDKQLRYYTTDFDGQVRIDNLPLARYDLKLRFTGYKNLDTTCYILEPDNQDTFKLVANTTGFEPFEIVTYQVPVIDNSMAFLSAPILPEVSWVPVFSALSIPPIPTSAVYVCTSAPILESGVGFDPYYCRRNHQDPWHFLDSIEKQRPQMALSVFDQNGKKGISDDNGKIIAEPVYTNIRMLPGIEVYRFVVQKDDKLGLMDGNGNWIFPCVYDQIFSTASRLSCIHKRHLLLVVKDQKYGLVTTNGDILCPPVYDFLEVPPGGYACPAYPKVMRVAKDGKYGCIDHTGKLVVNAVYDSIGEFGSAMYAVTMLNGKQGFITKEGVILAEPVYDQIIIEDYSEVVVAVKDKKWGVLSDSGTVKVPFVYDEIRVDYLYDRLFFVRLGKVWGLLNADGTRVIEPQFEDLKIIQPYGGLLEYRTGSKYGMVSPEGEILQPAKLDALEGYGQAVYLYRVGSKWGFVYDDGKKLSPAVYDQIQPSDYDYYNVKKGAYYGVCDATGHVILKPEFPAPLELYDLLYNGYCTFEKAGKFGLVDTSGTILIKPLYDTPVYFSDFRYEITTTTYNLRNGKPVVLNSKGVEIVGPYYDDFYTETYLADYFVVQKEGKSGLISPEGKKVCEPIYTSISSSVYLHGFENDRLGFIVSNSKGTGVIDTDGKVVIPFLYERIWSITDTTLGVTRNDSNAVINHRGEMLVPFSPYMVKYNSGSVMIVSDNHSRYAIASAGGILISELAYSWIEVIRPGQLFKVYDGSREGILKSDGTIVIPPVYENIKYYGPDFYAVKKDGLYGFMDSTGTLRVMFQYDKVKEVNGNYVVVRIKNKFGVVDHSGNEIIPAVYDQEISLYDLRNEGQISYSSFSKYGLLGADMTVILEPVYSKPVQKITGANYQVVQRNGLYGVLDSSYTEIVPCRYPSLEDAYNKGVFIMEVDLKYGLLDKNNTVLLPCDYELIRPFRYGSGEVVYQGFMVRQQGKVAVYDSTGKKLTNFEFDSWKEYVDPVSGNYIDIVSRGGKWYKITGPMAETEVYPNP